MCVYVCLLVYIRSMLIMKTTYKSTDIRVCVYVCVYVCLFVYIRFLFILKTICICVFTCVSLSIFVLC